MKSASIGCLALLLVTPIAALWRGYVLSVLWGWFIVPTFGAPALGVLPAIGVASVVGYLTYQYDEYTDDSKSATEKAVLSIAVAFMHPLFALAFGWVLYQFM